MSRYDSGAVGPKVASEREIAEQPSRPWSKEHRRYTVSVDQYAFYRRNGYLVVPSLVPRADVEELLDHTQDLMDGKTAVPGVDPPPPTLSSSEKAQYYLRIHMLHRVLEIHERFLLHPRILDVLQALIGPDILALQTMLFMKGPGKPGQGYHQDSYYIPTTPDSLCGAWLALDHADEVNGCLWMTPGSHHEPIYPPHDDPHRNGELKGLTPVEGVSNPDETQNDLTKIAAKYAGDEVPVPLQPGDVAFFDGHILHRSHTNTSSGRFRRAFVGHYCNARSFTTWNGGNEAHILARGDTHMPYAVPRFGTPCSATLSPAERARRAPANASMMGSNGDMEMLPYGDEKEHRH